MCVLSTLLLLWDLALLCGADSSVQLQDNMAPFEVEFHSVNFRNVLHWKDRPDAPEDLQYYVEYKVYGDKQWSVCEPCQAIHKVQCDLSNETSDPRQWYYARVQARSSKGFSPWVTSARFYPQWDTTFSPPKIKLNVTQQGIVVWIRPPRTPLQGPRNSRISVTKLMKLKFRIYLVHDEVEQFQDYNPTLHKASDRLAQSLDRNLTEHLRNELKHGLIPRPAHFTSVPDRAHHYIYTPKSTGNLSWKNGGYYNSKEEMGTCESMMIHETDGCLRKLLIEHLIPQTTYCVQAVTVMSLSGLTSSRSPKSCISTL